MEINDKNNIPIHIWGRNIKEDALIQASNLANLPFSVNHISLLPNAHKGYGTPIGCVLTTKNELVPSACGFDIGCGTIFCKTNLKSLSRRELTYIFETLRETILNDRIENKKNEWIGFKQYENEISKVFKYVREPKWKTDKIWELGKTNLGTLGGGNHFIELDIGSDGFVWILIHTGSRNIGFHISTYYQKIIIEENKKWYSKIPEELSFVPFDHPIGEDYIRDLNFSIEYAKENRLVLLSDVKNIIQESIKRNVSFEKEFDSYHNSIEITDEQIIHRRGAIKVDNVSICVILGSMGSHSYIVRGNYDSTISSGSGRAMSRNESQLNLNENDCVDSMNDIVHEWRILKYGSSCGKIDLSDSKFSFKDIDENIEDQKEIIEPLIRLDPILVLKG